MAGKVTHIYRVDIGKAGQTLRTHWVYAPNAKLASEYCKEMYKGHHYDWYHPVMVGETKESLGGQVISLTQEEVDTIVQTPAKDGDHFAEHRYGLPGV